MIEVEAAQVIATGLAAIDMSEYGLLEGVTVLRRMLDGTDPNLSIGVFLYNWAPVDRPNIGGLEPAIGRYRYHIQTYLKASVREDGELWSMTLAKKIRALLYRDIDLRLALHAVRENDFPPMERVIRYGVDQAEYTDAPITGGFAFFSQTQFWLETEVL